jgi:acyl-ACP thioesterase
MEGMITPLRRRFTVHSFDVDAFQTLTLPALAGYLEEVAARHADVLGCGLDLLRSRGCTWVLIRQRVEAPAPISLGDELEIETWPSGIDRLQVGREFLVRRGDAIVARCSTAWILVDLATRRPLRPAEILDLSLRPRTEVLLPLARRLAGPEGVTHERTFDVRYLDIDANLHVNNTSYVAWALEAIEPERWRNRRAVEAEVQFEAESRFGDRIRSRAAAAVRRPDVGVATPEGAPGSAAGNSTDSPSDAAHHSLSGAADDELLHTIVRVSDGAELARLRTRWVPR